MVVVKTLLLFVFNLYRKYKKESSSSESQLCPNHPVSSCVCLCLCVSSYKYVCMCGEF